MSTALTDTITWGYTAPSTINVYFLSDGSGSGVLNFASFTDPNGNTFEADPGRLTNSSRPSVPSSSSLRSPT